MLSAPLSISASLLAIGAILVGGIYVINNRAVDFLLKTDAAKAAKNTAHYFKNYFPDIEKVLAGDTLSSVGRQFLLNSLASTSTKKFKLYDTNGKLLLNSELIQYPNAKIDDDEKIGTIVQEALEVLNSVQPVSGLEYETEDGKTELIAETYVPIVREPMPSADVSSHILRNYQHQLPGATVLRTTAMIQNANAG